MDDTCAVCAEVLEWVAYGACGHRDVCSTCVARLRFICDDRRCCICKSESPIVFVTKALGDYTRMINDFSLLPPYPKEGRVGSYWYHEDTQAYFDDVDQYKMIKAMCRLSCSVCDKADEDGSGLDGPNRRPARFRNIGQLKGHLFHKHRLIMCSLCLEGRKVFICEQKLYTRAQLNHHINTGDSEVDGSESERGGFTGHPICEFCKTPFYGDNELYSHMSTEHYTCHICQRQHPGQYEYYKNYDDLELHFRRDHFLCEDEACLAKKFIVFSTEAEMKRHNALEHGGRMSRAQRNAALQIPTSFWYRRGSEQDHRRRRNRILLRDESDDQLSMAIEASLGTAHSEALTNDPSTSSSEQAASGHIIMDNIDPLIDSFESLTATDSETSSRYLQALGQNSRNSSLQESSFPPLPLSSSSSQQIVRNEGLSENTMASHLRRKNNRKVTVLNSSPAWPAASQGRVSHSSINAASVSRSSASGPVQSGYPNLAQAQGWPSAVNGHLSLALPVNLGNNRISQSSSAPNITATGSSQPALSDFPPVSATEVQRTPISAQGWPSAVNGHLSSALPVNLGNNRISQSSSAPNVTATGSSQPAISDFPPVSATQVERTPISATGSSQPAISDFPPVSATQVRGVPVANQVVPIIEDFHTANKSLVERLRTALEYDDDKYTSFKNLSAQYRQGLIDASEYLDYVQLYGLSHLVLELASLCPDDQKQRELVETYNARMKNNELQENGSGQGNIQVKSSSSTKKGKASNPEANSSRDRLADDVINTVRALQSQFKPQEEELEVLSRDGYRASKGKSNVIADEQFTEISAKSSSTSSSNASKQDTRDAGGGSKPKKKTSKFHRARLGDGSVAALLDLKNLDREPDLDLVDDRVDNNSGPSGGLPIRGVWRKGGVQKLFS